MASRSILRKHFLLLCSFTWLAAATSDMPTTCYYLDGSRNAYAGYRCNNGTTGHSSCCAPGAVCYSNGVCQQENGNVQDYLRVGCTDKTWKDPACLDQCTIYARSSTAGIRFCDPEVITGTTKYCCDNGTSGIGSFACCDTPSDIFNISPAATLLAQIPLTYTSSSTSSTASTSSKASSTTSSTIATNPAAVSSPSPTSTVQIQSAKSTSNNGVAIGAGVGVSVGVIALGLLGFLFYKRKNKSKAQAVELKSAEAGVLGGHGHRNASSPYSDAGSPNESAHLTQTYEVPADGVNPNQHGYYAPDGKVMGTLAGMRTKREPRELGTDGVVYEMPANQANETREMEGSPTGHLSTGHL